MAPWQAADSALFTHFGRFSEMSATSAPEKIKSSNLTVWFWAHISCPLSKAKLAKNINTQRYIVHLSSKLIETPKSQNQWRHKIQDYCSKTSSKIRIRRLDNCDLAVSENRFCPDNCDSENPNLNSCGGVPNHLLPESRVLQWVDQKWPWWHLSL